MVAGELAESLPGAFTLRGLEVAPNGEDIVPAPRVLRAASLELAHGVFDSLSLEIAGGPIVGFSDVTFANMEPSVTQLRIEAAAVDAVLDGLRFLSAPTGGLYLEGIDSDGPATLARVALVNAQPLHGLPKTSTSGGFAIEWGSPSDDSDGDGVPDAQELANGTDPLTP